MKIGDSGESFILVVPHEDGWLNCIGEDNEELRYGNYDDALNGIDDALTNYGGQRIFIIKQTNEVVEEIDVPKIDSEGNVE